MMAIYLASDSSAAPQLLMTLSDAPAHAAAYAALAVAMLRGVSGARLAGVSARTALLAAVLAIAYGVSDEFHQSFVAGRHGELRDVAADALGATGGAALAWVWARLRASGPDGG